MVKRVVLSAGLAAALSFTVSAARADEQGERVHTRIERHRVVTRVHHRPVVVHHRHVYRHRHRAWDGRYGLYPRRHYFVSGVYSNGFYGPVNYGFVTYSTFVYYTPTYPSVTFGYPPYAHVYGLMPGPVYNKPCLC